MNTKRKLLPVEGQKDLARCEKTGMIVNINKAKAEQFRQQKKFHTAQREEIAELKTDVADIKNLLKNLIEKMSDAK